MFWRNLEQASRSLRRTPWFVAVATLSLAFGCGATVGGFALLNGLLLRDLPVPKPRQLANVISRDADGREQAFSYPAFRELERRQTVFSDLFALAETGARNVEGHGIRARASLWAVSGSFFSGLGVEPARGRFLSSAHPANSANSADSADDEVVLGYRFWERTFHADPDIIGQPIHVELATFTVVGVAPPRFTGLGIATEPELIIPLTAVPRISPATAAFFANARLGWLTVGGRMKDGLTLAQTAHALSALWPSVQSAIVPAGLDTNARDWWFATRITTASGAKGSDRYLRSQFTGPLLAVIAVGLLNLLITCVSLAGLMLARAAARTTDVAVRFALGARVWQVANQVIAEAALITLAGIAGSLFVGYWTSHLVMGLVFQDYLVPAQLNLAPDWRLLAVIAIIAFATVMLVSAGPIWLVTRRDLIIGLRQQSRTVASGSGRLGRVLVVIQLALSLVLLMSAGLLIRTQHALLNLDSGYHRDDVVSATLAPGPSGYAGVDADTYYPQLVQLIGALPHVRAVSLTKYSPGAAADTKRLIFAGASSGGGLSGLSAAYGQVSPGFFDTIGMHFLSGRDLTWTDDSHAPGVVVISQSLALKLFARIDVVGERIALGTASSPRLTVVGVVNDARLYDPRDATTDAAYVPMLQAGAGAVHFNDLLVRIDDSAVTPELRPTVQTLGREDILTIKTLDRIYARTIMRERVVAMVAEFFGGLALSLAGIGLFGLMAYAVVQREREIAIRMTLGATRARIVAGLLRDVVTLVVIAVAFGIPAALLSVRLFASLLFELRPNDLPTLTVAIAVLFAVGLLAALIPARRAASLAHSLGSR
jgi:predicted permease